METQILEDIGFTHAEIKIYLSLLELGTSTAGPIIEKSHLQSSVVHMTLGKLSEKGFISFVNEGKRKHYQATDPKQIIKFIDEKKERYEELLPKLLLKQQMAKEKPEIISFSGIKGIKQLLYELLEDSKGEHNTFGSTKESLILGESFWIMYHKKRAEKKIKARLLFNESLQFWKAEKKYPLSTVKYTKAGFEPLTETIIRNTCVGIIIWTEKPLGVLIKNKVAAESYTKFFEVLWKNGLI